MKYTLYQLLQESRIIVPLIQRDYAQGRDSALTLRKNFLLKMKEALTPEKDSLNLDFIYGYSNKDISDSIIFTPLDGQQRLTTLWLIHWYFSAKENIINPDNPEDLVLKLLRNFSYETRSSSKRFCDKLVTNAHNEYVINGLPSIHIKDASWFMAAWENDPTVVSMLNMIDTIHEIMEDCQNIWENLTVLNKITFDYIDIKSEEFKLTDELYIKMNSRGKPLTSFENFKAQFSDLLSSKKTNYFNENILFGSIEISYQQYFAFKIDSVWMDLFWGYRSKTEIETDSCILNYIYFIAEVLYFKNAPADTTNTPEKNFQFLSEVFIIKDNILFLFNTLDLLSSIEDIEKLFKNLFSNFENGEHRVVIFEDKTTDLFLRAISDSNFDVKHKILLYSFLYYSTKLMNHKVDTSLKHFMRVIHNLLLSVRRINEYKRIEYRANIYLYNIADYAKFIDGFAELISSSLNKDIYSVLAESDLAGFSKEAISLEKSKADLFFKRPELIDSIFILEDHEEIQGNLSCFNLECINFSEKAHAFNEIWHKNADSSLITRAFLTAGDFTICTHANSSLGGIFYFGSKNCWNRILTTSIKDEKNNVTEILDLFLEHYIGTPGTSPEKKLKSMISSYHSDLMDWQYYFIKYKEITSQDYDRFNLFTWDDESGYDINNLGNSGLNPLLSYHLNPYLHVLENKLKNHGDDIELCWGRYSSEISYISIRESVDLYSVSAGWKIRCKNDFTISRKLSSKYSISKHKEENSFIINVDEETDRIKLACAFIEELIPEI